MILAGDIGGTRARLALFAADGRTVVRHETFESRAYRSLDAVLREFLGARPPRVEAATLGIAGPVRADRCEATNLPWTVDARATARRFGFGRTHLINDLVALALGALVAPRSKLRSLSGGTLPKKRGANLAILAAGTGLGEAALVWNGEGHVPLPTEGGHSDFAARGPVEAELTAWLTARHGRATWEHVLSGPGIGNLYDFFRDARGARETAANDRALALAEDRNAAIAALGQAGASAPAGAAIDLFVRAYGAELGNLALRTFALGGVYVAGNIAASMADRLDDGEFLATARAKAPMDGLLKDLPVALVLDSSIGLSGAAHHAAAPH